MFVSKEIPLFEKKGMPLNWQLILNYLYREGIIENPDFSVPRFRADKPPKAAIALRAHYNRERTDARDRPFFGYGSSMDFDVAISKAIGELLERYFGTVYKVDDMIAATSRDMSDSHMKFLAPERCSQFEDWQLERFSHFRFSDDTPFRWLHVEELVHGAQTYVPAQLMYWMYDWRGQKEPLLAPLSSNGSAGHFSRDEAIISAIHECIERDGFLIYWMNALSPRVIEVAESDDKEIVEILDQLARYNMKAYFLNLTTDIPVPVSACVLVHDEGGEPFMTVGAAAGRNAKESLMSSYYESLAVQHNATGRHADVSFSVKDYEPFTREDIGMEERIKIWHGKHMYERASFFISGESQTYASFVASFSTYARPKDQLNALIDIFRARGEGYEIYAHLPRHRVLSALGYHVARVYVPALMPMHLHEQYPALRNKRLAEVPRTLGYEHPVRNIFPHPFP